MARVKIHGIKKTFEGGVLALQDISFEVAENEMIVVLGPSGCGKTTLLMIIAGLLNPTSGDVYFDDEVVTSMPTRARNISMVFQDYALYPHLTVRDNLAFGLKIQKIKKDEIKERVNEIAQLLHIYELLDRKPSQLSGGQKQRVAIGRAIIKKPNVFLFDEPLASLDALLRLDMRREIKRLHGACGGTYIYVTHDQSEAQAIADRIVIINDGTIQQIGTGQEIYKFPKNLFVASFFGLPTINVLANASVRIESKNCYINLFGSEQPFDRSSGQIRQHYLDELIICVRPEHIRLSLSENTNSTIMEMEELCSEQVLYIKTDSGEQIRVKNSIEQTFLPNTRVMATCEVGDILVFNKKTNKNIFVEDKHD